MRILILLLISLSAFADTMNLNIKGLPNSFYNELLPQLSFKFENNKSLAATKVKVLHGVTLNEIKRYLNSKGYYSFEIANKLNRKDNVWDSNFTIELGKPTVITKVDVNLIGAGSNSEKIKKLQKIPSNLEVGNVVEHDAYEAYKEKIILTAFENGYIDAEFNLHEIRINKSSHSAEIFIELDTKDVYTIGNINFLNSKYNKKFLKKFDLFKEHEVYTAERLSYLQNTLNSTDLFSDIRVIPIPDKILKKVNIEVSLKDKSSDIFSGGIGFSTNNYLKGNLSWQHNFKQIPGNQFLAYIMQSNFKYSHRFAYSFLGSDPIHEKIQIVLEDTRDTQKNYNKTVNSYITQIYQQQYIKRLITLRYINSLFKELKQDEKKRSKFLLPTIQYVWTNDRKGDFFSYGTQVDIALRAGIDLLLSSTNIVQSELNFKKISLLDDDLRFIFKTQLGGTFTDDFDRVPIDLRFFGGGDNTIRGYAFKSIGPTKFDKTKDQYVVIGGKYILTASGEMEKHLFSNLSVAGFVDAGSVTNDWNEDVFAGVGVGFRAAYPVGAFKFDVAKPLMSKDKGGKAKGFRIHLSLKSDF